MADRADEQDLPVTWPFTFGACLILLALVWFCGIFAFGRSSTEPGALPAPFTIFWIGVGLGVASMILGAIVNVRRAMKRGR